ncbi:MAG: MBL fold metallo-hydrolase [Cyanobacteria bacterium]|nr:MBL fold metallo-hydrolase [Cyanobacteriota bacterium]
MADKEKIVPGSVPGNFFVDTTCINCDTCRAIAPAIFGEYGDFAGVKKQPSNHDEHRLAMRALLSCPTGSIGTHEPNDAQAVLDDFPLLVNRNVYHCGFNSPRSAGGFSYLVIHPGGNWMIDAPRFHRRVEQFLDANGGLKYIVLTHKDDCGDEQKYATRFGAKRIIHRNELEAQPNAELVIEGFEPIQLESDFTIIPQPGHTDGHCMLLYDNKYLFSGDVFTSDRYHPGLNVWPPLWTWGSWAEVLQSLEILRSYQFSWVLPGHGRRVHTAPETMPQQLDQAIKNAHKLKDEDSLERLTNLEFYTNAMAELHMPNESAKFRKRCDEMRERLAATSGKQTKEK